MLPALSATTSRTPFEAHDGVIVKREDLSSPLPGPCFSKIRGVYAHIRSRPEGVIGVLDTIHSRGGWAVAYVCALLGKRAVVYYPEFRDHPGPKESQVQAAALGAAVIGFPAGRSAILYHQARKDLALNWQESYLMPNALKLAESVEETAAEVLFTPDHLIGPSITWVVPVSSGTIASGVVRGLALLACARHTQPSPVVLHLGYSRPETAVRRYVDGHVGSTEVKYRIVDEGFTYRDSVQAPAPPFPCSPFYDRKAWRWLLREREQDRLGDVVFWNVG